MEERITSSGRVDKDGIKKLLTFMRDYPVKEYIVWMTSELWEYYGKPDRINGYEVRLNDSLDGWEAIVQEKAGLVEMKQGRDDWC